MRLACVVPATNHPATLPRCVAAIESAREGPDELIVVTEAAGEGPAAARNEGVERSSAELIAFVDADVLVREDAFAGLRAAFDADRGLAAVFGAYDDDPEATDVVSSFRNLLHHWVHLEGAGPAQTFWAGLGAVRRDAFEAAGGFDAGRYREPSIEDVELGMRLAEAGGRIRLDPAIQGKHLKQMGVAEMVRTDFARRGLPWARLLLERPGSPAVLNLGWRHRVSALASLAAAAALLTRRPRTALLALASLIALNAGLYRLLLSRRGPAPAAAGVALHLLHHLAGSAAAGTAGAEALAKRLRPGDRRVGA